MPNKIRIAIIAGGFSNERDISLMTAAQIAKNLPPEKYDIKVIEIAPDKTWLLRNDLKEISNETASHQLIIANQGITPAALSEKIDVAFLALHGQFGEDGRIQAMLDYWNVPYTGSGVLASALGMNKLKCLEIVHNYSIKIPRFLTLVKKPEDTDELNQLILESFGYPAVVKPNESGSSIGISIVKQPRDLAKALAVAFQADSTVIIEEFIKGRELACAVLGNTGVTELETFPPIEIIVQGAEFFDYQAKYFSKETQEICPAHISPELTAAVQEQAKKIHAVLGCHGLSRSDFILRNNELYFLEINTIPGQTEASLAPKAAQAAGLSFAKFLEKQIELALLK